MDDRPDDLDVVDVESIACMLSSQLPYAEPTACKRILETMALIVPLMVKARADRQRAPT